MHESRTLDGAPKKTAGNAVDRRTDYLDRLLAAHAQSYDISRDYRFEGRTFPAFAEFHTFGEQYVLVKRAKLWEVNSHDFMFFAFCDHLDSSKLAQATIFMCERAITKVAHGKNHMSSALTLVLIADSIDDDIPSCVRKTHFRKNYLCGIHGWSDLRLAVVNLRAQDARGAVFTNSAGKPLKKMLENNLSLSTSF